MSDEQTLPSCLVCRNGVRPDELVRLQLGGKDLGAVHREPCAGIVRSGVTTLGKMVLTGANVALASRAPKVHAALEAFRGLMHKLNAPPVTKV